MIYDKHSGHTFQLFSVRFQRFHGVQVNNFALQYEYKYMSSSLFDFLGILD